MRQKDFIISALKQNGGFATLNHLYHNIDTSSWKTKTPQHSIRRILQTNEEFYKIEIGLWGLKSFQEKITKLLHVKSERFTHAYYQGIIVQIGNFKRFNTFIPPQDKNKLFLTEKLCQITSLDKMLDFSYLFMTKQAQNIDVVWFNERNMPNSFFEVEHTSNFKNSINKFYELQDFRANFYIVAHENRQKKFESVMKTSIYKNIRDLVRFIKYENIVHQYENMKNFKSYI